MIEFFVPHEVRPKGNRGIIMRSPSGKPFVRETDKYSKNQDALILLFSQHAPPQPIEGPVRVSYRFQYPWRTSDKAKARALGFIPKPTAPDLGQLTKRCDDVLQACGFVTNDSQIASYGETEKVYTDRPGVSVRIERITAA